MSIYKKAITLVAKKVYTRIPPHIRNKLNIVMSVMFACASVYSIYITIEFWKHATTSTLPAIHMLITSNMFVIIYILIALSFVYLTANKKDGLATLNDFSEKGLLRSLRDNLGAGIIYGIILGLFIQVSGIPYGFFIGFIFALLSALVVGVISGYMDEFE